MKTIMRYIRSCAAVCCAFLTLGSAVSAKDVTLSCKYVDITGDGFVADTLNGIPARYNTSGHTLFCDELVRRYYMDIYGVAVQTSGS